MTGPGDAYSELPPNPRLLHTALLAGGLFGLPIIYGLRWIAPLVTLERAAPYLRYGALAVLFLQAVVVRILRTRITSMTADMREEEWWRRNTNPAVLIWCIGALLCFIGSIVHFLTGDPLMLFVGGGGIVLLILAAPGRLMRR